MMNNMTIKKLHDMRLSSMADAYGDQINNKNAGSLSFEDRFGLIVDAEWSQRQSNHITKLIKNASLRCPMAAIEDIEYKPERQLDKSLLDKLSCCGYLHDNQNIIIMGPTGAGKTYIACALANSACRCHYSAKYVRLPDLMIEMAMVRGSDEHNKLIKAYKKIKLLIIDEWLLIPLMKNEAYELLEFFEARYDAGSTIFCSQYGPANWHEHIGIDVIADAVLDRIVHNLITIEIKGESMRKAKASKNKKA